MDVWQIDKLGLFLIFLIPGFISTKVYDLLIPGERRDFSKSLFEVIAYSAINFALLSWLIILIHSKGFYDHHQLLYFGSLFLILFIFPILWPFAYYKASSWSFIAKRFIHPIPKPWDYVFGKRQSFWVIVHLKDKRRIGGRFDTNSFASSYPAKEQIYLEEVWELGEKGNFVKRIDRSKGIVILGDEIVAIEFFE
jgi:hypothetical protein